MSLNSGGGKSLRHSISHRMRPRNRPALGNVHCAYYCNYLASVRLRTRRGCLLHCSASRLKLELGPVAGAVRPQATYGAHRTLSLFRFAAPDSIKITTTSASL
jgi:hypothetical protein